MKKSMKSMIKIKVICPWVSLSLGDFFKKKPNY